MSVGWEEKLAARLREREPRTLTPRRGELAAAVLVPLLERGDSLDLLIERRPETLPNHGGQLSFPGGVIEEDDRGPEAAAIREAGEEVGLDPSRVRVLGRLPDIRTPTGFVITPVVAVVSGPVTFRLSPEEVAEVVLVPVDRLLRPGAFELVPRRGRGLLIWSSALVHGGHVIWGATARILQALRRVLLEIDGPWRQPSRDRAWKPPGLRGPTGAS